MLNLALALAFTLEMVTRDRKIEHTICFTNMLINHDIGTKAFLGVKKWTQLVCSLIISRVTCELAKFLSATSLVYGILSGSTDICKKMMDVTHERKAGKGKKKKKSTKLFFSYNFFNNEKSFL